MCSPLSLHDALPTIRAFEYHIRGKKKTTAKKKVFFGKKIEGKTEKRSEGFGKKEVSRQKKKKHRELE